MWAIQLVDGTIQKFNTALEANNAFLRYKNSGAKFLGNVEKTHQISSLVFSRPPAPKTAPFQHKTSVLDKHHFAAPQHNKLIQFVTQFNLEAPPPPQRDDRLSLFIATLSSEDPLAHLVPAMIAYFAVNEDHIAGSALFVDRLIEAIINLSDIEPAWCAEVLHELKKLNVAQLGNVINLLSPFILEMEATLPADLPSSPIELPFANGQEEPLAEDELYRPYLEQQSKKEAPPFSEALKLSLMESISKYETAVFLDSFARPEDFERDGLSSLDNLAGMVAFCCDKSAPLQVQIFRVNLEKFFKQWAEGEHKEFIKTLIQHLEKLQLPEVNPFIMDLRNFIDFNVASFVPSVMQYAITTLKRHLEDEEQRTVKHPRSDGLALLIKGANKFSMNVERHSAQVLSFVDRRPREVAAGIATLLDTHRGVCVAVAGDYESMLNDIINLLRHGQYNSCRIKFKTVFLPGVFNQFPLLQNYFENRENFIPSDEGMEELRKQHQAGQLKFAPNQFAQLLIGAHRNNVRVVGVETPLTYELKAGHYQTDEKNRALDAVTRNIIKNQSKNEPYLVFVHSEKRVDLLLDGRRPLVEMINIPLAVLH